MDEARLRALAISVVDVRSHVLALFDVFATTTVKKPNNPVTQYATNVMIQSIGVVTAVPTTAEGTWDPHVNAVFYDRANYTYEAEDTTYSDDAAEQPVNPLERFISRKR